MSIIITEQVIREKINEVSQCESIGEIKILFLSKIDEITGNEVIYGTEVILGMNNKDKPILIVAELLNDDFLTFFEKEMYERGLNLVSYYTGTRTLKTETMI
jgi:hypothetical protein